MTQQLLSDLTRAKAVFQLRQIAGIMGTPMPDPTPDPDPFAKNWDHECDVCGQTPSVEATGLCGPCTWGEADTVGGNW